MKDTKFLRRLRAGLILVVVTAVSTATFTQQGLAATGNLYLAAGSSGRVQKDNNVRVALRIDPGATIDGVQATINYDQTKLEFVSFDGGDSAFPALLRERSANGRIQVARGNLDGRVTNDALITELTFKALTSSGNTTLDLSSGNATANGGYMDPTLEDATIGFNSGPSAEELPPGPPTHSDPVNVREFGLKVDKERVELTKVRLSVTTSRRVRAYAKYGTNKSRLNIFTPKTGLSRNNTINLDEGMMIPGTVYYFQVIVRDSSGRFARTKIESIRTKGYTVNLVVLDKNEAPVANTRVTLHSDPITATTDKNGRVTFRGVAPGNHRVEFKNRGKVYSKKVNVLDPVVRNHSNGTQSAEPQVLVAKFGNVADVDQGSTPITPATVALVLLAAGLGAFYIMKRRRTAPAATSSQGEGPRVTDLTNRGQSDNPDELIRRAKGVDRPDPGSVVDPKQDDDDKDQR